MIPIPLSNPLLVQCLPSPIWPPVHPLSLTFTSQLPRYCLQWAYPIETPNIPGAKSHVHFSVLGSFCQRIRPGPRLLVMIRNKLKGFTAGGLLAPAQPPSWRTTPCRLSATAYSVYSHQVKYKWYQLVVVRNVTICMVCTYVNIM
jgi:hypothetical protein